MLRLVHPDENGDAPAERYAFSYLLTGRSMVT